MTNMCENCPRRAFKDTLTKSKQSNDAFELRCAQLSADVLALGKCVKKPGHTPSEADVELGGGAYHDCGHTTQVYAETVLTHGLAAYRQPEDSTASPNGEMFLSHLEDGQPDIG